MKEKCAMPVTASDPSILPITEEQFAQAHGQNYGTPFASEVSWWSGGRHLGVVTRDRFDGDFGYVLLSRDERGVFRAFDLRCSIASQAEAEFDLAAAMRRAAKAGAP